MSEQRHESVVPEAEPSGVTDHREQDGATAQDKRDTAPGEERLAPDQGGGPGQ